MAWGYRRMSGGEGLLKRGAQPWKERRRGALVSMAGAGASAREERGWEWLLASCRGTQKKSAERERPWRRCSSRRGRSTQGEMADGPMDA
ncbi:hypothetical protein Zm00014a_016441 [Zea mays]|uniref:Uncharacterized protein n=1 Tax=Zea mays TaxID=4577 RepID=A0A3L6DDP5_MAIZE|nr:hypothetical protein Zm00014a_016441 [Zea mays]